MLAAVAVDADDPSGSADSRAAATPAEVEVDVHEIALEGWSGTASPALTTVVESGTPIVAEVLAVEVEAVAPGVPSLPAACAVDAAAAAAGTRRAELAVAADVVAELAATRRFGATAVLEVAADAIAVESRAPVDAAVAAFPANSPLIAAEDVADEVADAVTGVESEATDAAELVESEAAAVLSCARAEADDVTEAENETGASPPSPLPKKSALKYPLGK